MTFEQRLSAHAAAVERHLGATFERSGSIPGRLAGAMRHALLGGGKRFRPFLTLESAALLGVASSAVLPAACAIECVHCYSLVHDDLPAMDNDDLRRGRPTVWKAFGEWTAILAGDALLTLAFEILASNDTHPDAGVRSDLVAGLAAAAGARGMVGGQCLDLEGARLDLSVQDSVQRIDLLQSMKTGALIAFACEAGAILGRATTSQRRALSLYGEHLGSAYQIADDLLDVDGNPAAVGKALIKDAAAGKATLVALLGVQAARAKLAEAEAAAVAALATFGDKADVLVEAARFVSRRQR